MPWCTFHFYYSSLVRLERYYAYSHRNGHSLHLKTCRNIEIRIASLRDCFYDFCYFNIIIASCVHATSIIVCLSDLNRIMRICIEERGTFFTLKSCTNSKYVTVFYDYR